MASAMPFRGVYLRSPAAAIGALPIATAGDSVRGDHVTARLKPCPSAFAVEFSEEILRGVYPERSRRARNDNGGEPPHSSAAGAAVNNIWKEGTA
ncbi:MAG: hypothetical protein ACRD18_01310 [Terriglobia bacterium]